MVLGAAAGPVVPCMRTHDWTNPEQAQELELKPLYKEEIMFKMIITLKYVSVTFPDKRLKLQMLQTHLG